MTSLDQIKIIENREYIKQKVLYNQVFLIQRSETPMSKSLREDMGLSWSPFQVLLDSRWHIDRCYRDGKKLESAVLGGPESSYAGGMDLGAGFVKYKVLRMTYEGMKFEQCPKCKLLYCLPPSPEDLERIRRTHGKVRFRKK